MYGRKKKAAFVLSAVMLFGICFLFGSAQASACEHEWSEWAGKDGLHRRECTLCHRAEDGECTYRSIVLRPTCTEGGYTEQTCTVCRDIVKINPTEAVGHSWNEGVCTRQPTCVDTGKQLFTCTVCRTEKTESIPATGKHTNVVDNAVPATCTQTGLTDGAHCGVCNAIIVARQEVAVIPHEWDHQNAQTVKEPTCADGIKREKCLHCEATQDILIPAIKEHGNKVTINSMEPNCTTDGHTEEVICPECKTVLKESKRIPAWEHRWDVVTLHTQPTCDEDGFCDRTCKWCSTTEQYARIPATGHKYETAPAKEPTCTEKGYTASCACSVCGDVLASRETVKARGHDFRLESSREPTCTASGIKLFRCTRCAEEKTETTERTGHDFKDVSATPATCTKAGLVIKKCSRCPQTFTQSLSVLGHDAVYAVTPPTCTAGGHTSVTCSRCDYTDRINPTEPTGHKGVLVQQVKPTCLQGGYDLYGCSVCGYEYRENITQVTDHTWAPGLVTQPTCTEDGHTTFQCLVCKQTKTSNIVPAAGHSLHSPVSAGDGTHTGVCSVCNKKITEACSGDKLSCLQKSVCAVCGGSYGNPTGKHSFTKWTVVNDSLHRLDCADCDTVGEKSEKHAFQQGDFVKDICAFTYTCKQCSHKVWGRPIGDADGDGVISTVSDARAALRYAVGLDEPKDVDRSAADLDRDGELTASDARKLLRAAVGLETVSRSVLFVDENGNLPK